MNTTHHIKDLGRVCSALMAALLLVAAMSTGCAAKTDSKTPTAPARLNAPASVGNGAPFLVEFTGGDAQSVTFAFAGKTLRVDKPTRGKFQALLPVQLNEKSPSLPLTATVQWKNGKSESFKKDIIITQRDYPVQRLRVDPKFVTPPPELAEKIKRDRAEIRSTVTKVSPQQYWTLPLMRPVPGQMRSVFGVRRVFNGVPKSAHRGVDFRGAQGSPIRSVEAGVVALVSNHYYGGNTVIVDHGLGVFSVYLHMSAFNVRQGQRVQRGDVLGQVGSTGRSTGPHLHYSFYVLGDSVDGAVCLDR